jgi:hypothetical protein
MCNFLHYPVTSSLLGPNTLLSIRLNDADHVKVVGTLQQTPTHYLVRILYNNSNPGVTNEKLSFYDMKVDSLSTAFFIRMTYAHKKLRQTRETTIIRGIS